MTFDACHFEGNNSTDIYVEDDVVSGPSISNSYFNNSFSPVLIKLNGKNASVENCEFERFMDTVVEIKGSQNRIIDNIFKPKSDAFNVTGIILEKQSEVNAVNCEFNFIERNTFIKHNQPSYLFECINLQSSAENTLISLQHYDDAIQFGSRVIDNSNSTQYQGKISLISDEIDLSQTNKRFEFPPLGSESNYIVKIIVIYTEDVSTGITVRLGKSSGPGNESLGHYFGKSLNSGSKYSSFDLTDELVSQFLSGDDLLILSSTSGLGKIKFMIDVVPYKI